MPTLARALALFLLGSALWTAGPIAAEAARRGAVAASAVTLVRNAAGRAGLLRDGKPYFIQGAGANDNRFLDALAAAGGNSVRLWGDERLGETLDAASRLGLTVTAGIWLPQVRGGFNFRDAAAVAKLREQVRATVERHRGHPGLLIWALGNEVEDPEGKDTAVWTVLNDLAKLVKSLDPSHPTMTVIAEIGGEKVPNLHRLCPDIDIVGINTYAGAPTLGARYGKAGGTKPYIVTEFGPPGIWEIGKDPLGAYPEPTSTQKAEIYAGAYRGAVLAQPELCLGAYVFLWGQKQEVTATWFSMFLVDGSRLAPVDVMTEFWTGRPPENRCPAITTLALRGDARVAPGATVEATLVASDPEKNLLRVSWALQRDPETFGTGGDAEKTPPIFPEAIVESSATGARVRLPATPGLYRLFATVRDDHGGAAVANVALRVTGSAAEATGNARRTDSPGARSNR